MIRSGRHYPGVFYFQEIGYGTRRVTLDHYPGIGSKQRAVIITGHRALKITDHVRPALECAPARRHRGILGKYLRQFIPLLGIKQLAVFRDCPADTVLVAHWSLLIPGPCWWSMAAPGRTLAA